MSESDPAVTLEFLDARLNWLETRQARQATWTLLGLLGVLAGTLVMFGASALHASQAQQHSAVLLRVCSVGAARMPEGRAAYCERALPGFRIDRAAVAADAVTLDSLGRWAQSGATRPWVPPTTTTVYPDPPP